MRIPTARPRQLGHWLASILLVLSAPFGNAADHQPSAGELRDVLATIDCEAVRLAVDDLIATQGARYAKGADFRARLATLERAVTEAKTTKDDATLTRLGEQILAYRKLSQEALLANPLIDFDQLLLVRRSPKQMGLPHNWNGNSSIPRNGYDNEIAVLSPVRPSGTLTTVFKPPKGEFVGDLDLHFDAKKLLFSMPGGTSGRWKLWEINVDGKALSQVSKDEDPDLDNYDGAYLPDGGVVFMSSATYQGVPCVGGSDYVANLYRMDIDGSHVRRLCFDQEMNWSPMVMNDGRVLYTRWEYTDTAHYFTRLLFTMNPDGTGQQSVYGSNSY